MCKSMLHYNSEYGQGLSEPCHIPTKSHIRMRYAIRYTKTYCPPTYNVRKALHKPKMYLTYSHWDDHQQLVHKFVMVF